MKDEKIDKQILSIITKDDGHLNASKMKAKYFYKNYQNLYEYLDNRFDDLNVNNNFSEILYRIRNNIENAPICPICKNKIPFTGNYKHACSRECMNTTAYKQIMTKLHEDGCLKKYGVKNPFQAEQIKQKIKETWVKHYGVDHPNKNKEQKNKGTLTYVNRSEEDKQKTYLLRKQTCLKKYGDENYRNIEKIKQTCLERYGVTNPYQKEENKQKILEKYGTTNVFANENIKQKIKQTCLERYGVESFSQSDECLKKIKQTCLERYGVENPMQCEEIKNKSFNARVKNNSIGKSLIEIQILDILKNVFKNVIHQYKSNLYPFHCDYYIQDYDVYIELQGNWTHGNHPFDETNQNDIDKLNKWKEHSHEINYFGEEKTYYLGAIETWTIYDPKKRLIAAQNNLNYLEIFSCDKDEILRQINDYFIIQFNKNIF